MAKKLSRRDFLRLSALGAAGVLASCKTPMPTAAPTSVPETKATDVPVVQETLKNPEELMKAAGLPMPGSPEHPRGWKTELPDLPMGYPLNDPIVITTTRRVDTGTKFMEGDDLENNPWSRMVKELFGIELKVAWTWSTGDEANQKYNLAMAGGDMPDIMETVPASIFVKMVEADMLLELGPIWDQYASKRWQDAFAAWGTLPWVQCTVNDKRYGLPRVEIAGQNDTCLWVRQDWLDKLGLKVPTTLEELHDVAKAFVDNNLSAGAVGTTVGLMANMDFRNSWYGSLDPIWGSHGLSTNWGLFGWSKSGDGLQYDGVRPETKEATSLLRQWYADGIIRKDFYTVSTSDSTTDLASGNCGLHFTPSWGANRDAVNNDPNCVWTFADVPTGPNGFKGKHTENPLAKGIFACPKDFKYAKEWIELTNWRIEKREDPERRMHGWRGADYDFDEDGKLTRPDINYTFMTIGPTGTRGGGFSDPEANKRMIQYQLEEWAKIPAAERDAMQEATFEDPLAVLGNEARLFLSEHTKEDGLIDQFQGLPTPMMVERGADLAKLESETLLSIITGERSLDAFDEFVAQWKQQGGDQVILEVNDWWKTQG